MKGRILIGSRGSRLAEIQAGLVLNRLKQIYSDVEFDLLRIKTQGDEHDKVSINKINTRGVFVKEIQEALIGGRIDIAVHSLKDMPVHNIEGLCLAAVTERLDPRDVFISKDKKLRELPADSVIGTGSPRRVAQLLHYRSDLKVVTIRGNVDTRLRKVFEGEIDGIIIAAAGILRLGLEDRITEYLPVEHFLPQAAQGVLGIETRVNDSEMLEMVRPLHHGPTWQSIVSERAFLEAMGGGCSAAVACLGTVTGDTLLLRGMGVCPGGNVYASEEGGAHTPEEIAYRLAQKLLAMGAVRTDTEAWEA